MESVSSRRTTRFLRPAQYARLCEVLHNLLTLLLVQIGHHNLGALLEQVFRDSETDAWRNEQVSWVVRAEGLDQTHRWRHL